MASSDQTLAVISTLAEPVRTSAYWLVWAARTAGYPVIVTSGKRTIAEQRELVRLGRSSTLNSRHLAGLAFDIDWQGTARDAVPSAFWWLIGPWAEQQLGLRWGGRWKSPYDPGHFEAP